MAQDDEVSVLNHFVQDAEEGSHTCNHCGKRYGADNFGKKLRVHLTNCEALSRSNLLFEKLKPMIWAIQIYTNKGVTSGTGFSVSSDGLIMTVAHIIEGITDACQISVHTLDKKFTGTAKLVDQRPEADLALLKVSVNHRCESLMFLSDAWVTAGEKLVTVGVGGTYLMGYASFACTEIKEIRRGKKCKASTYDPKQDQLTKYRVLGDIYNAKIVRGKFEKSLNPYVPIIQGQLNTIYGNSGSPVFNIEEEIVGIVHGHAGTDFFCIHVSEVVNFLDAYIKKQVHPPLEYATKDIQKKK